MRYLANETISAGTPLPSTPPARTAETVLDDASELSLTRVAKHLTLGTAPGDALVDSLRAALAEARAAGRPLRGQCSPPFHRCGMESQGELCDADRLLVAVKVGELALLFDDIQADGLTLEHVDGY